MTEPRDDVAASEPAKEAAMTHYAPPREAIERARVLINAVADAPSEEEADRHWGGLVVPAARGSTESAEAVRCAANELRNKGVIGRAEAACLAREMYRHVTPGSLLDRRREEEAGLRDGTWRVPAEELRYQRGDPVVHRLARGAPGAYVKLCKAGHLSLTALKSDLGDAVSKPDADRVKKLRSRLSAWAGKAPQSGLPWGKWTARSLKASEIASMVAAVQEERAAGTITRYVAAALMDRLADETLFMAFVSHLPIWAELCTLAPVLGRPVEGLGPAWTICSPEFKRIHQRAEVVKAGWLDQMGEGWMGRMLVDQPKEYLLLLVRGGKEDGETPAGDESAPTRDL